MKKRKETSIILLFALVGMVGLWFGIQHLHIAQPTTPCDDPEYLILKNELAHASPDKRQALLESKGQLLTFLETERARCLQHLSQYTPIPAEKRPTVIAAHRTQMAAMDKKFQPTPLVSSGYEGPIPAIAIPTIHSDEFLPSQIAWRLMWQGIPTMIEVGWTSVAPPSPLQIPKILVWPMAFSAQQDDKIPPWQIVSLSSKAFSDVQRIDIVTVCKPFVVIAAQTKAKQYLWVYDLSEGQARPIQRSSAPCWDPQYKQRDAKSFP